MKAIFCLAPTASNVLIKKVVVPQENIVLDSNSNGRYFYSGEVTFDLESDMDSVNIHVFLEVVPIQRYIIIHPIDMSIESYKYFNGNAPFQSIDSLCTGDVGWIRPRKGCTIHWQYSTTDLKNHCRIKIGTGNYLYAHTKTEYFRDGVPSFYEDYRYNNLGLVAQFERTTFTSETDSGKEIKIPKYSKNGQLVVDDTTNPFITNVYDEKGRAIFRQEAVFSGLLVNFVEGYVYDSLSRAVQILQLNFGATAENPGEPVNVEDIVFDAGNRIIRNSKHFGCRVTTCDPIYEFSGKEVIQFYYKDDSSHFPDSTVREFREDARNGKLVSIITNKNTFRPDGLIEESVSISQGMDDPGACWGVQDYDEQKSVYFYDSLSYRYRIDLYEKNAPDSPYVHLSVASICNRREYDTQGNTIRMYDFCDENEKLVFKAEYNDFNHIIRMEDTSVENHTTVINYTWSLIDLDLQDMFFNE